jgi:hypothetical protein
LSEGREIVAAEVKKLKALSREDVLRLEDEPRDSRVKGPSGRAYRLRVRGWDDEEEGESGAEVKLYGTGLRSLARLRANAYVPDADMPEAQRSALAESGRITNRTQDVLSAATMIAVITALIAPWFIGVGFLISLVL